VAIPLAEVLVEGSSYSRRNLKLRLYGAGLKHRRCEMCGQGELWRGQSMSLILDHVNGVPDDNRLENLRILCPNCNSTLDTHCGRKNARPPRSRKCQLCGQEFAPKYRGHAYCSSECGSRHANRHRKLRPERRKVERPSYEQLLEDLAEMSVLAVGRKYGVSDNAVRKWLRWYEAQTARDQALDAGAEDAYAEADLAA
jgi:Zn finger protein HypA/HybF involved in hydrogenase expression